MSEATPLVAMDEAGHSGENLLDAEQPVFALAAVHVTEADAQRVVDAALSRTGADELKFSKLRRRGAGRDNILQLLKDAALTHETAFVAAAHKPWMLAAKLVDELVEPRMTASGLSMPWCQWSARSDGRRPLSRRTNPAQRTVQRTCGSVRPARPRLHAGTRDTTP